MGERDGFLVAVFGNDWMLRFLKATIIICSISFTYYVVFEKQLFFSAFTLANTLFQVSLQLTGIYVITEYFKYTSEINKRQYELTNLLTYRIFPTISECIMNVSQLETETKKENREFLIRHLKESWSILKKLNDNELDKFSLFKKRDLSKVPAQVDWNSLDIYLTAIDSNCIADNLIIQKNRLKELEKYYRGINQ